MGTEIKLNDTLVLNQEQGFPKDLLDFEKHKNSPQSLTSLENKTFTFEKEGARVFHLDPVRVFLVESINDKWLFWGKVVMLSQTIKKNREDQWVTQGNFKFVDLYDPEYQRQFTSRESKPGKSFFDGA